MPPHPDGGKAAKALWRTTSEFLRSCANQVLMATLPVEIINVAHGTRKPLDEAVLLLNAHQDAYRFTILDSPEAIAFQGGSAECFQTAELFQFLKDQRKVLRGYHPHLVAFVERRLDGSKWGNLLASADEDGNGDLTGLGAVTWFQIPQILGAVPEAVYGIYQLLSLAIRFTVGAGMIHQERRMCVFDFKRQKTDLLPIIQQGELCPPCTERLKQYVDQDQLVAIRSTLRMMSQIALAADPRGELDRLLLRANRLPRIFLSHAREDKPFVEQLATDLEQHGCRVWFDKWAIKGSDFVAKIEEGLRESDHFAIIISPSSVASSWVAQERNIAIVLSTESGALQLLVIMLQDAEIPTFLKIYDPIDFRNYANAAQYQAALEKLLQAVSRPAAGAERRDNPEPRR